MLISILVLHTASTLAQNEKKESRWHIEIDLRYQQELYHNSHIKGQGYTYTYDETTQQFSNPEPVNINDSRGENQLKDWKYGGNTLMFYVLYDINSRLSIGAGVAIDRSFQEKEFSLPVFATLRYMPWATKRHTYLYTDFGYSPTNFKGDILHADGIHFNLGIGKSFRLTNSTRLDLKAGYHLQQLNYKVDYAESHDNSSYHNIDYKIWNTLHNLQLSVGLVF